MVTAACRKRVAPLLIILLAIKFLLGMFYKHKYNEK
jgi:hypothetical protein